MADGNFDASDYERPPKVDRWRAFLGRYRACSRIQASIDNARAALQAALLDVRNEFGAAAPTGQLEAIRRELQAAESALYAAREGLRAALDEKKLTPESRQPEFWK